MPWLRELEAAQASLPLFALGAKQSFYKTLLPTAYSVDVFTQRNNNDPTDYGTYARTFDFYSCYKPYRKAPTDAYWSFPNIGKPTTWDTFIFTQTKTDTYPGTSLLSFNYPSQSLLNALFDAPEKTGNSPNFGLSGGAGMTRDDLMPVHGGYLIRRDGYLAPGSNNDQCKSSQG